jgi:hypothetical protein
MDWLRSLLPEIHVLDLEGSELIKYNALVVPNVEGIITFPREDGFVYEATVVELNYNVYQTQATAFANRCTFVTVANISRVTNQ